MEYRAIHRFADMSARKIRPFAALIRGRSVDEALELLRFEPNKGARLVEAVLSSAAGNAENRGARDVSSLIVSESRVDDGPMFKRIMPRSRGTANVILRRMAHVIVAVSSDVSASPTKAPAVSVTTPTAPVNNPAAPAPAPATETVS